MCHKRKQTFFKTISLSVDRFYYSIVVSLNEEMHVWNDQQPKKGEGYRAKDSHNSLLRKGVITTGTDAHK